MCIKIIFLDIDGVLNSRQSSYLYQGMLGHTENEWVSYRQGLNSKEYGAYTEELCPISCSNLKVLLDLHPDARIVISSTWRRGRVPKWFNILFQNFKIFEKDIVIGTTPSFNTERGFEIKHWLDHTEYQVKDFVIIDDDGDMGPYKNTSNFVQTNNKVGFDYLAMEKVDKLFGGFNLHYKDLKPNTPYKMYSKPREINYLKGDKGMYYIDDEGKEHTGIFMYEESELFSDASNFEGCI